MAKIISPSNWKERSEHDAPMWVCIDKLDPSHKDENVFYSKVTPEEHDALRELINMKKRVKK